MLKVTARPSPAPRKILDVAASLFCLKGYEATSTSEIATALGIQKPTLYHHVTSKQQLLFEIVDDASAQVRVAVRHAVADAPTAVSKVEALINAHVTTMLANRDYQYVLLTELRSLSESNQQRIEQDHKEYGRLITSTLIQAQQVGAVRADIAGRHLGLLLTNLMNWTIFWYRGSGELSPEQIKRSDSYTVPKRGGNNHPPAVRFAGISEAFSADRQSEQNREALKRAACDT